MKYVFLLFLLLPGFGFTQPYQWAKAINALDSYDYGWDITTDKDGNVYITGVFSNGSDFDPGPGVAVLNAPQGGAYIAKYDACGNYIWAKAIASASGTAIGIDGNGDVLVTGTFTQTTDFDPGPAVADLTLTGSYDIYFAKYDANGNYIWAKSVGGAGVDQAYSLAIDNSNNICLTGYSTGVVDFDPGNGVASITSSNMGDIFVAKYSSAGNYVWAFNIPCTDATGFHYGFDIAVDKLSNIYVTGSYRETADFDPNGSAIRGTTAGIDEYFCAKYDAAGNFIWANSIEGVNGSWNGDAGHSVAVNQNGDVFVSGWFNYSADFDPGTGADTLNADGGIECFFMKYDTYGNYQWAKRIGGTSDGVARNIEVGPGGNIYVSGKFRNTGDFDPGSGVYSLTAAPNANDIFVGVYNPNGDFISANRIGSEGFLNECFGMSVDASENLYITGGYSYTCDFDFSADSVMLTASASVGYPYTTDIYLAKYGNTSFIIAPNGSASICGTDTIVLSAGNKSGMYTWSTGDTTQNIQVNSSGIYSVTVTNPGCIQVDSIQVTVDTAVILNLQVPATSLCTGDSVVLSVSGASAYQWWPATGLSATTGAVVIASPMASTTYQVAGLNGSCADTASVLLSIVPGATAGNVNALPDSVCAGSTTQLTNSGGASMVRWQSSLTGNGFTDIPGADSMVYYTPVVQNTFYRVIAGTGACSDTSQPVQVVVKSLPAPPVLNASDTLICSNDSSYICAVGAYASYLWNTGATTACIYAKAAGAYWLTVTGSNQCASPSGRSEIEVYPVPSVSVQVNGDTLVSFGAVAYQWILDDNIIPGATSSVYVAGLAGYYAVQITDTNDCQTRSTPIYVGNMGIAGEVYEPGIDVYPNPAGNFVVLQIQGKTAVTELRIYDMLGQEIKHQRIAAGSKQMKLELLNLPPGVFKIVLYNEMQIIDSKVLIHH